MDLKRKVKENKRMLIVITILSYVIHFKIYTCDAQFTRHITLYIMIRSPFRPMNIGHILNGLGGPVLVAGPPLFSATWFPPHQRTTSTGILTSAGYVGVAVSFFLGPTIVTEYKCTNSTR